MNRALQAINFCGVLVLIGVCVWQWGRLRQGERQSAELRTAVADAQARFAAQEKVLRGTTSDLETFRGQLQRTAEELGRTSAALEMAEGKTHRLARENAQLQEGLTVWKRAVDERDARLSEANDRIGSLSDRLNASIDKFNRLVSEYNGVVKTLNEERAAASATAAASPAAAAAAAR